ncbi:Aste57867_11144 [Aphanomyces stellatus]|uniref:Aste57867_11144 protein n=1 Tax=Aphanomyces stellatus TaxID=120398 RepID=A0A485KSR1_9STRA|nr:hypothetical protein As57867_011102 [Aphanomyces stellatus]VFT88011.1 Aste57867_11144 [Aphanomyces stellatus]
MGSGASTQVHRRRALIRHHNRHGTLALSHDLEYAFEAIAQPLKGYLPLQDIAAVLEEHMHIAIGMDDLHVALTRIGSSYHEAANAFSIDSLVQFTAPRSTEHQTPPTGLTIWAACKIGDVNRVREILSEPTTTPPIWSQRDNFDNIPLYYASVSGEVLCGHKACVELVLPLYKAHGVHLPNHELLRCITNGLNPEIKKFLQGIPQVQPKQPKHPRPQSLPNGGSKLTKKEKKAKRQQKKKQKQTQTREQKSTQQPNPAEVNPANDDNEWSSFDIFGE